jgi:hypothetical protein
VLQAKRKERHRLMALVRAGQLSWEGFDLAMCELFPGYRVPRRDADGYILGEDQ